MKSAYLIGIGGIGVSALAQYLHSQGYTIYGANQTENAETKMLERAVGAHIYYEHNTNNIPDGCELVIYSPAIPEDNPERKTAGEKKIPTFSYPEYLGELSKTMRTIAVAGTNGKTTTTTMIATILDEQGFDPTVIMGGIMPRFDSNFRAGASDLFVVEACEYKGSFLSIHPDILVINNITPDHLDYFGTVEKYIEAFVNFVDNVKEGGKVVIDSTQEHMAPIKARAEERGLVVVERAEYAQSDWQLPVPGRYNEQNADFAVAASALVGADTQDAKRVLEEEFLTAKRRFELLGMTEDGATVHDDYAHNPEGITLLVQGIRERFPDKRIVMAFQPHMFSRTQDFFKEFTEALSGVDALYLLPIYPAREKAEDFNVTSVMLADSIMEKNTMLLVRTPTSVDDCVEMIEQANYGGDSLIVTVGAGVTNEVGSKLVQ